MKIPPPLQKGDTIGLLAPAGFMPFKKMQTCIETLDSWGYTVELGATTHSQSQNYFSGTDEERLADLQKMLDSKKLKAILCARGGYGFSRMIDKLNFKKFKKHPKWIIGFSDVTVLLTHLQARLKTASIHGPMAAAFNDGEPGNPYLKSLKDALEGQKADYTWQTHPQNRHGEAEGELVGGNLSLLVHLIGTASEFNTKRKILFLEDIGEQLYNIDRMLWQLKRAGKLNKLSGLILGGFTDCKDTDRPFGKTLTEILQEHIEHLRIPVCFNAPVSHEKENYALKIGGRYKLSIDGKHVNLLEK